MIWLWDSKDMGFCKEKQARKQPLNSDKEGEEYSCLPSSYYVPGCVQHFFRNSY